MQQQQQQQEARDAVFGGGEVLELVEIPLRRGNGDGAAAETNAAQNLEPAAMDLSSTAIVNTSFSGGGGDFDRSSGAVAGAIYVGGSSSPSNSGGASPGSGGGAAAGQGGGVIGNNSSSAGGSNGDDAPYGGVVYVAGPNQDAHEYTTAVDTTSRYQ